MKTWDIHTHLLNPNVRFQRLFDRITLRFFASKLGVSADELRARPYEAYVSAMARAIKTSRHVEKACIFGVDSRLDEQGREIDRDNTVCAMSEDVLAVAQEHPEQFVPFLSVNPRRPGALDLIDEYVGRGCRGAKFLQNYWGVDLNNEAWIPYYEKLKALEIPLIIHIGSEYSINSYAEYERIEMLRLPLESGVTIIAAHMGLGRINHKLMPWRNLSKNPDYFDEDYFMLLELLKQHDNLYADTAAILAPLRARALRHLAGQKDVHHKILFGTDYPVPFSIVLNTYDLDRSVRRAINEEQNPFDRYAGVMLEYFPEDNPIYSNYKKLFQNTYADDEVSDLPLQSQL